MAKREDNLKPFDSNQNREEAKKNGRKGGKASGESRRRKKAMRESFETLFAMQCPEKVVKAFKKQGLDVPDNITYEEALTYSMMMKAMGGDARMTSLLLDVTGDKFSDQMRQRELEWKEKQGAEAKTEALDRLDSLLEGLKENAYSSNTETE